MYNAIIPDHLLHATGVFKERLSQSALYHETTEVTDAEARDVFRWIERAGMRFHFGRHEATDLTRSQVLQQCRMYVAALRIADRFGCDLVGIQYQQGLKDLLPASDLVEGMLNDSKRPPVTAAGSSRVIRKGRPLVHFNEVDECAGLDGLLTQRVHGATGTSRGRPTSGCGCWRSPGARHQRTSSAAGRGPRATGSRRCTSGWAAARWPA
jgi:hypothetical protein